MTRKLSRYPPFQPGWRIIKNGIMLISSKIYAKKYPGDPPSVKFSMTASCNFGLKAFIRLLSRDGWTRLVNRITIILRSRSIQKEVPVNPRCPTVLFEKYRPQLGLAEDGVSNPSVRPVPSFLQKKSCVKVVSNTPVEADPSYTAISSDNR